MASEPRAPRLERRRRSGGESVRQTPRLHGHGSGGKRSANDDRVRVIANLIEAEHERSIRPALRVERRFDDIFTVQTRSREKSWTVWPLAGAGLPQSIHRGSGGLLRTGQHEWKSCFSGGWRPALEH
jgi:hypothetical protein